MPVIGDMRKSEFRNKQIIYGEIVNHGFLPMTVLRVHATRPEKPEGRIVKMHKRTVQRLKTLSPWQQGEILMTLYYDRREY